jgi:hypothetical protein
MRYHEILAEEAPLRNGTPQSALSKMAGGYLHGLPKHSHFTCYAYAGAKLAELQPPDATIRLWGRKSSGMVAHGDAVLPDGAVISSFDPADYEKMGYELVHEIPLARFLDMLRTSAA